MKKVFKFALVAFMAAAVAVSCKDDPKPTPEPEPQPEPQPEYTGPVQGESAWSVIGTVLETNWDTDYVLAEADGIFVLKNLKLAAGNEFKIRENKGWDNNRGGDFAELGAGFDVTNGGANIKPELDGIYDVYYNPAVEQMAITAANGTPSWKELPKGLAWDYVLDIKDWHINSTFMFDEVSAPIKLNPAALSFQVKFFSNKWNNCKFKDTDANGYQLYCNRLGEFSNAAESQTVLLRFSNDGSADGQLCLNAGFLGLNQDQLAYEGSPYVWSTGEWHVITITSDGTKLSVYDNETLLKEYSQSGLADEWKFARYDISMTWKEGSSDNDWPLRQAFNGFIAYTRAWSKALTAEEVAASLCDVPADSEGLEVYWVYNCEEGSVVANQAANKEFALDFAKAWDGNGSKNNTANYAEAGWTPVEEIENGTVCPAAE